MRPVRLGWMPRAAASPDAFLERGLPRYLAARRKKRRVKQALADGFRAIAGEPTPIDVKRLVRIVHAWGPMGDFRLLDGAPEASLAPRLAKAGAREAERRALVGLVAGAVPIGVRKDGTPWLWQVDGPARGAVFGLSKSGGLGSVFASAARFALHLAAEDASAEGDDVAPLLSLAAELPEELAEHLRERVERASLVVGAVVGADEEAKRLGRRIKTRHAHAAPDAAALEALFHAWLSDDGPRLAQLLVLAKRSPSALTRDAAEALRAVSDAKVPRPPRWQARLAARRGLTRAKPRAAPPRRALDLDRARRIVAWLDETSGTLEPLDVPAAREEALLALGELAPPGLFPELVSRAEAGDIRAVEMLAAMGDRRVAVPTLLSLLERPAGRYRWLEAAVVRALAVLDARDAVPALRRLLVTNPLGTWREGIERGPLVRELVAALGRMGDVDSGPITLALLESRSGEYKALAATAAHALGSLAYAPAFGALEARVTSTREPVTPELVWAFGRVAAAAGALQRGARALEGLTTLDPGIEVLRQGALLTLTGDRRGARRRDAFRAAIERALWEPGFRQEDTSRRRAWAFRALADVAASGAAPHVGAETVRYFAAIDDHRVRRAATAAFTAAGLVVPKTRRYYAFVLEEIEARAGRGALRAALSDPLGLFRYNIATFLADRGDLESVGAVAGAAAIAFAEPPTTAYEYDDAPRHLEAFASALARLNTREGNDVLIEALRSGNHQVRAVVAEHAPPDERIVPELVTMLEDPRSFLRARAERALESLGVGRSAPPPDPSRIRLVEG